MSRPTLSISAVIVWAVLLLGVASLGRAHAAPSADASRIAMRESLAREALDRGDFDAAIVHLRRALAIDRDATLSRPLPALPGAGSVAQALERLEAMATACAEANLPDFRLPKPITHDQRWAGEPDVEPFLPADPAGVVPDVAALVTPVRHTDLGRRYDRIVYLTNDGRLVCRQLWMPPVGTDWRWSLDVAPARPKSLFWVGCDLILWDDQHIVSIDDERGRITWRVSISDLLPPPPPTTQPAAAPTTQPLREQILFLRPMCDRVVLTTSLGRVAALNMDTGAVAWQARPTTAPLARAAVADGFVVVRALWRRRFHRLFAYRADDGAAVYASPLPEDFRDEDRRDFLFTMAPDGALIWSTAEGVSAVDLRESDRPPVYGKKKLGPRYEHGTPATWHPLALVADQRYVYRIDPDSFELQRLDLLNLSQSGPACRLGWIPRSDARICPVRQTTYVVSILGATGYGPSGSYELKLLGNGVMDAFFGRHHVAFFVLSAGDDHDKPGLRPGLSFTSRQRVKLDDGTEEESGLLEFAHPIAMNSAIRQLQPIDGGFCYLTANGVLHFLAGARRDDRPSR